MSNMEKRVVKTKEKNGLDIADIILVSVLLAAGAVLKYAVGSFLTIGGMKPNFIIAMYCLAILIVKPRLREVAVIGLLAGAVCQAFPGTPYINLASELIGAVVMSFMIRLPLNVKSFSFTPVVATFVSTVASGSVFTILLFAVVKADISSMAAYVPIVLCTAIFNAVIIQVLYPPMKKVLKK